MRLRRDTLLAILLALLGLAALAGNWQQPLVRNSLVYARVAEQVLASDFDPLPVVADSRRSYDKPIAFAWLSAPLVAAFGTHHGLMLASALGFVLLVAAAWQLLRAVVPAHAAAGLRARALAISLLSPLAVYQAWSAHPDGIETALLLSALAQTWTLVVTGSQPTWRRMLTLAATIEVAGLFKNYGLILLPALPLAFAPQLAAAWRRGKRSLHRRAAAMWTALGGLVVLALSGHFPWQRIAGEGGGAGQYGRGELLAGAGGALLALLLTLGLCLHAALPWACRWRPLARGHGPLLAFAAVYCAGLLPFPNSYYNLRYFLPIVPIAALGAAVALEEAPILVRRAVTGAFLAVAGLSAAVFNVAPLHAAVAAALPDWRLRGAAMPGMLDNLRMQLHRQQRAWLDAFAAAVPRGASVYMLGFRYYGDAQHGVYERAGLIRPDITTRYVQRADLPQHGTFLVGCGQDTDAAWILALGTRGDASVEPLGGEVFSVTR